MALQALYMCLVTPGQDGGANDDEAQDVACVYVPATCAERVVHLVDQDPELPDAGHLPAYAKKLLVGTASCIDDIDAKLAETSQNWSVERMPVVDHAILLLSTYEMLNETDVPVSVCINEAVELAKGFGGEDDSARFVNGLLGRIARTYCADRIQDKDADGASDELMEA